MLRLRRGTCSLGWFSERARERPGLYANYRRQTKKRSFWYLGPAYLMGLSGRYPITLMGPGRLYLITTINLSGILPYS